MLRYSKLRFKQYMILLIALPTFLADEKERATTRYVNITTIATFFSSVTATTLQMTISAPSQSVLWNVVNFFWFISLVFSVSSGVSSLLGMTWRKSSMWVSYCLVRLHLPMDPNRYDTTSPPLLIRMWFDKAPIVFLIISALMFIIGLNLFAYLSSQVCKSSVHRIAMLTTSRLLLCHYQPMRSQVHIVYVCLSWLYGSSISSSERPSL